MREDYRLPGRSSVASCGSGTSGFPFRPGRSVLDAANAAVSTCRSRAERARAARAGCGVLSGAFETDTRGMFSVDELAAGWRLACQTLPTEDLVISP